MKKRIAVSVIALVLAISFALPAFAAKAVPVTDISLGEEKISVPVGTTVTVKAVIKPKNATNKKIEWSSSDKSVATVTKGKIKGVGQGTAVITAKATDDNDVSASIAAYHNFIRDPIDHKECARDKLGDRTATCRKGKVLKLERWEQSIWSPS